MSALSPQDQDQRGGTHLRIEVMITILLFVAILIWGISPIVKAKIDKREVRKINHYIEECDKNNETYRDNNKGGNTQ